MISGDELAFVRLAMRKRLLRADQVKQAVERKKWDTPDRSLRSILVDMGALANDEVVNIRDELRSAKRPKQGGRKQRETQVGRDQRARDSGSDTEHGAPTQLGNYRLLKLLGAGAMGAVYDAINVELDRPVALKLLLTDGAPSPRAVQRFKREARLAARLDHPNVVRVYEAGQDQGYHYIAMDKVVGHSVAELITLAEMTPRRAAHVMRKVCLAVGYGHQQEVIHRDLKPANILVEAASGEARVTDFGLAVLAEPDEDDRLTRTGAAVGTPAYMAPEQVRGQLDQIDARSDIYALGATFYEMLTSTPPFEASTFLELAKKICDADPSSPRKRNREVPLDLETICLKALEKRKEERYQTAEEMAEDLANFLNDEEIVAQRPSLGKRIARWSRRRPALVAGMVGFLGVVIGAAAFYLSLPGKVKVTSVPPGAVVLVDNEPQGQTPIELTLAAGNHEFRFKMEGFLLQARGIDTIDVAHGSSFPVAASLVSTKGVLEIPAFKAQGARVRIYKRGGATPFRVAATPFEGALPGGDYDIEVTAPGFHSPPREQVSVSAGGLTRALAGAKLVPDPTQLTVSADPENVVLAWSRGEGRFLAPHAFGGSGKHLVTGYKPGYLPRRFEVEVLAGDRSAAARVTLPPLAAARLPLEGLLLGQPVLQDIDADGAVDVLALVEGVAGRALVLLPGQGGAGPRYRISTGATDLLGAYDIDADGDLDAVLGGPRGVEIREGLRGNVLLRLPIDGRRALLLPRYGRLAYARSDGEVELRPLSFRDDGRPWLPANRWGAPPAFLSRSARAVAAHRGQFSLRGLRDEREKRTAANVETGATLIPLQSGETEYLLALPRRGPALLYLAAGGAPAKLGREASRFQRAAPLRIPQGTWVFLYDAVQGKTRVFAIPAEGKPREDSLQGVGLPVAVEAGIEESRVWTSTGRSYRVTRRGWFVDELRTTDASGLVDPAAVPLAADLDGDGLLEVVTPSPDRRALLLLEPDGSWLRWRARGGGTSRAVLKLRGRRVLALARGSRIRFLDLEDGRELLGSELSFPNGVFGITIRPGPQPQLYVAYGPDPKSNQKTPATLAVFTPKDGGGWEKLPPVQLAAVPRGLLCLERLKKPLIALSAPLTIFDEKLAEVFRDSDHDPAKSAISAAPIFVDGRSPVVIGSREDREGRVHVVSYELASESPRTRELGKSTDFAPLSLAGAHGVEVVAVEQQRQVTLLNLPDLSPAGTIELTEGLVALTMTPAPEPILFLVYRSGRVEARVPTSGRLQWARTLPPGPRPPSAVQSVPASDAVSIVAPSGTLLLLGLRDGAYLGELRAPNGGYSQVRVVEGQGDLPPLLLLQTTDDHVLSAAVPPLERPEPTLRQRVGALRAAVRRGEPDLSAALPALESLANTQPRPQVQLALAEAYLGQGNAKAALRTVTNVLRDETSTTPQLLRVQIVATYLSKESLEPLRPLLEKLKSIEPRAAAAVAHELALRGGPDQRALVELATTLDPRYPTARATLATILLGGTALTPIAPAQRPERLGQIEMGKLMQEAWRGSKDDLKAAYSRIVTARFAAQHALVLQESPRNRARALIAVALEHAILQEVASLGQKGVAPLLTQTQESLRVLAVGGPVPARSPRVLNLARRLEKASALSASDRAGLLSELYDFDPSWLEALCAIQAWTR